MQRMNIKCCHCGDYTPFITEENIEVIPQVNLTRTDMDILLKHAKVPHTYGRRWPEMDRPDYQEYLPGGRHDGGEQIIAYDAAGNRIWDGIWGWGSYGFEQGLIEVMGTQLVGHDDLEGWLTARQVTKMWRCRNAAKNR